MGHRNGQLIHRSSADDGMTWSSPVVIAPAAGNFPAMYGGLAADGDNVFLITAPDDMSSSASAGGRQLDFRRSTDNGATWSSPLRITTSTNPIFRARIAARGQFVHVAGVISPTTDASLWYFRSTNGGASFTATQLDMNLGPYGGGQTVAVDGSTVHIGYTRAMNGVGAGPTLYVRSVDDGATWSPPVTIGESSMESSRQARVQVSAQGGRVFVCWQREGSFTGAPLPADRLGFTVSLNGGTTWSTPAIVPGDTGVDRNHHQIWMGPGGSLHVLWRHGDSGDTVPDAAGYRFSPDDGVTWRPTELAIDTRATLGANHPWSMVADADAVHVLAGPSGTMQYACKRLP